MHTASLQLASTRHVNWGVVPAYVAAAVAFIAAGLTFLSARSDRAQLQRSHADEKATAEAQLATQRRQLLEAVDREHFRKLWEMRQKSYLEIATWALALRESIRLARESIWSWNPPILSESENLMAALYLYAASSIYDKAGMLHGGVSSTVEDIELHKEAGPEAFRELLESYNEEAWQLVMLIREYALQPPAWREPIPFD